MNPALVSEEEEFESRWRSWQEKGRKRERESIARRLSLVKVASMIALLLAAIFWSQTADYEIILRFVVTFSALFAVRRAFLQRKYLWMAAFLLVAVLYNPLIVAFPLRGGFAFGAVIATSVFFGASVAFGKSATLELAKGKHAV